MACALKYEGIVFESKKQLADYLITGVKPESNITLQEVRNDIIKNSLSSPDVEIGVNDIIGISELTGQQRSTLSDTFGVDTAQAYVDYVETGNISTANKNTVRPIFQDISTNIKDIVSSVEYANSQQGSKPIEISPEILQFTNKIKINDSQRFIPTIAGSEGGSSTGVLQSQEEKWFNPRSEGKEVAAGEIQTVQEPGAGNINRETTGNNVVNGEQQRSVRDGQDSTASEINTARDSGVYSDGNPRRIQLATGEYVSWDSDTREWTNIVRNVAGDRWGTVRPASQRERAAAAEQRANRIITGQSDPDVAINLIFGQGDPISNLSALKGMGYINLNPTELYVKLKTQFDNNSIGIDQIASAIGTDMYPSLFSIVGENAINNMDNKIVLENLNVAKEMEASGLDPQRIKIATGWERGEFDKKWRYELEPIVSINNDVTDDIINRPGKETFNYGDLFSGLETAYPNINKIKIIFDDTENFRTESGTTNGYYIRSSNSITFNKRAIRIAQERERGNKQNSYSPNREGRSNTILKTLNHEIQHFIQYEENFLKGTNPETTLRKKQISYQYPILLELENNPNIDLNYLANKYGFSIDTINYIVNAKDTYDLNKMKKEFDSIKTRDILDETTTLNAYFNNAGEVEARNAEERLNTPMHVRLNTLLQETEDTPRDRQIIINDDEYRNENVRRNTEGSSRQESEVSTSINGRTNNRTESKNAENSINASNGAVQRYPSNLENPKRFFSNLGFAPAQTELLSFIHGLIPDAYNKTNTAIKIAIELMYPEQTGFNIMNMLPYTKEEMYDIMTKYQNENISNNLGDVFIHEYINNEMSFGMTRNKEVLDTIINKAKSLQIKLPQQYENYFQATNKFKSFFTKGQKLRNKEDILYVHDINYSNPEDITYVLWHPQEDAYYEMDMLKMDLFREDTESDFENMEDNAVSVINALEQIGTMVRFMPQQDSPGIYNIFNNEIYLDVRKLSNRLLYHEAAHAVFTKGIRLNKDNVTKLHTEIANVLRNGTPQERALAGRLDFFVQRYNEEEAQAAGMPLNELRAHEFLAELVAQLASNNQSITSQSEKSIIDKIIKFFRNILGYNQNLDINNIDDVIEMINGIANKLRTGETINFSDYESMMSDENINQGVLYSYGDFYEGDVKKILTPGKKIAITLPDGKGAMVTIGLTGTNNDGDGFTELEFIDGKTERYKTEHLVLRENITGKLQIYMLPAASQKANPTHAGNVLSDSDKQMLKEFALEQKADGTYEYSINDIHSLIKDDVQVDYNVFVDIINGFREEQALTAAKSADPISDDVYNDFVDNNSVSQDVLESIADKVATRKKLSKREEAIFVGRTAEINKIIADYASSKTPTTPVAPAPGPLDDKVLQQTLFALRRMSVTREVADILRGVNNEKLITFDSGDTIENKRGEAPENSQLARVFETKKALEEGRMHLATLKKYFQTDQFNKIIDLLDTGQAGMVGTEVLFVVMSQDLTAILEEDPSSAPLVRAMRKKLDKSMQAYARNASIILNLRRMANINPDTIFTSSSIANSILTPKTKAERDYLLEGLYQEELDKAYEKYEETREAAIAASKVKPYTKPTSTTTLTKRKKSDPSKWVPRGGGFLDSAIRTVKDYINKNC